MYEIDEDRGIVSAYRRRISQVLEGLGVALLVADKEYRDQSFDV